MKIILTFLSISIFIFSTVSCTSKSARNQQKKVENSSKNQSNNTTNSKDLYLVTKVVDGDTFWVDNNTAEGLKIRLIGVDAPESRNVFKKVKQPYGVESKTYLTQLLRDQYVRLGFDIDSLDQYQRTLAYAYLENGEMINELIVKTGNAIVMTIAPNIKHEDLFIAGQRHARENSLGLWGLEMSR